MTLEAVYFIASIIAAFGVVISLIFVGLQVRQNTSATQAAAAQAVHSNFATWYTSIQSDPALMGLSIKGLKDYPTLSEIEKGQFIAMIMAFSSHAQDAFYKWREGSLSPELWRGWELVTMNLFSSPGGKDFWSDRGYMFGESFQHFINTDLMKRPVHPGAKPFGAFEIEG